MQNNALEFLIDFSLPYRTHADETFHDISLSLLDKRK